MSKLVSATGLQVSEIEITCLGDWNITEDIRPICLNTTASNTGDTKGCIQPFKSKFKQEPYSFLAF